MWKPILGPGAGTSRLLCAALGGLTACDGDAGGDDSERAGSGGTGSATPLGGGPSGGGSVVTVAPEPGTGGTGSVEGTGGVPAGGTAPVETGGSAGTPSTPPGGDLCAPCEVGADCGGENDACLINTQTDEHFCGRDCSSEPCPDGFDCTPVPTADGTEQQQCIPEGQTCIGAGGTGGTSGGTGGAATGGSGQPPEDCDPSFRGPFCENDRIIGFQPSAAPANPTKEQVRQYNLEAVNHLRSRTCLPPLVLDDCLHDIAERALEVGGFHTYFIENCMSAAYNYGANCECNWAQENIGMASGSSRTWRDGVEVPLCGMMEEPFGTGHRGNIENPTWKRLGVGISWNANGASWHHEFGCDASLASCPR